MGERSIGRRSRPAAVMVALAALALVTAACQPPPPPPPPERMQLQFALSAEQPLVAFGYDIRWVRHDFQIRMLEGYEFCEPRLESVEIATEPVHGLVAPGDPELDGVIVDGWIAIGGRVVFSVVNNQACWNQELWAKYGGHPFIAGWDMAVDAQVEPDGAYERFSGFQGIDRGDYTIVK